MTSKYRCKKCQDTGEQAYDSTSMRPGVAGGMTCSFGPCSGSRRDPRDTDCPIVLRGWLITDLLAIQSHDWVYDGAVPHKYTMEHVAYAVEQGWHVDHFCGNDDVNKKVGRSYIRAIWKKPEEYDPRYVFHLDVSDRGSVTRADLIDLQRFTPQIAEVPKFSRSGNVRRDTLQWALRKPDKLVYRDIVLEPGSSVVEHQILDL